MEGQELRVAGAGQETQRHRKALGPRPGWGPAGWRGDGLPPQVGLRAIILRDPTSLLQPGWGSG